MDKGKGKGKSKSKPTLRDSASDFMAQWKASRPEGPVSTVGTKGGEVRSGRLEDVDDALRNRKRGGGEVTNRKGAPDVQVRIKRRVTAPSLAGEGKGAKHRSKTRNQEAAAPACAPSELNRSPTPMGNELGARTSGVWQEITTRKPKKVETGSRRPTAPPSSAKSLRQRLLEASADVRNLRIAAGMSRPRGVAGRAPVVEAQDGRLAILGLDFGTAFTKAVVRWSGRHYAVDWSDAVEGGDHHLLASVFSEAPDGRCVLGAHPAAGWSVREGIKLQLLSSEGSSIDERMADAVIFIALAFRYVDDWLRRTNREVEQGLRWRLHVGLPTKSWDSDATTVTFKTVAQAARVLACMSAPVTRSAALEALRMTEQVDRPAVDVFPEFACQLYSYLLSPERREDLHALIDIGAGTLDIAYFNVFMKDGETLLPIFASEVESLGAHYLIAALSGAENRLVWSDSESSLSDAEVGLKLDCSPNDVRSRRSLYLSSVAEVFNLAAIAAKETYPTSPAFQRKENVRLFLCGGGSRIPSLQTRFERIAREAASILDIRFQVSELVRPHDIVGKLHSGFDRLSVAYGLSQNAANIGSVMRSATLEPVLDRSAVEREDRDASR